MTFRLQLHRTFSTRSSDPSSSHYGKDIAMTDKHVTETGYDQEDAYFHRKDAELLARRRADLDARRKDATVGKLKCPRCGSEMNEVAVEHVKMDRCTGC